MLSQRKAEGLLVLTTLIAACGWVFSREALSAMPPMAFLSGRFLLASMALLGFCRRRDFRILAGSLDKVLISGGWQACNMLLWIYAVAITPSLGEGAFIMSLSMLFVPLVAWAMLRARPIRAFWASLPLAVIGLGLLTLHTGLTWDVSQILFLAAALFQAIYFCYNSHYVRSIAPLPLASIQLACTGLASLALSACFETWPKQLDIATWGWLLGSAFIATSLRFWLQLSGQSITSAANAALVMVLEPLFTFIVSASFYGESMRSPQLLGCGLILLALFYYRWRLSRLNPDSRRR
ncbi:DMT family transporter [Martelella alba]|uniref:DMT family transporter n=1 Tax=Martelella alba TaxID=2590451 RepID=A0ABY2SDC1_9HYPH|nr:DMT family transporter [Martelella alba]